MLFTKNVFITSFFNLEALDSVEKKRTKLMLLFSFVWIVQSVFSSIVSIIVYDNKLMMAGHLFDFTIILLIFYSLHKQKQSLALVLLVSLALITIVLFTNFIAPVTYAEYFYLFLGPLVLVFTDNKFVIYTTFIVSYLAFLLPNQFYKLYPNQFYQDAYTSLILFIMFFYLVYHFKFNNSKNEKLLEIKTKELEELNQFQSQFFINISHEIKTPLTLIKGQVDKINETEGAEKIKKQIDSQVNNIKRIVDDVIDLSKMSNSSFNLHKEVIDLQSLLYKIHLSFESLFAQKNIVFSYEYSDENYFIIADALYLERAINNLVLNAYKYTNKEGKVLLKLSKTENMISFSVSDTGIGIETNKQIKIFNRFYQIDNDVNKSGGSGVGLAFTKEIVGLLNGKITVESELGLGANFTINFPFANDYKEQKIQEENTLKTIFKSPITNLIEDKKRSVLIVDDSYEMREYLTEILAKYNCYEAENGVEALEILNTKKIDFVLTDYMMPKMNGFDLITNMKNHDILISTLMLTARSDYNSKLEVLRLGIDDYLSKPFDKEELLVRIQNILANQSNRNHFVEEQGISKFEIKENTQWISKLKEFVILHSEDPKLNQVDIAQHFNISKSTFYRKVKMETGLTPNEFITEVKLLKARSIVEQNGGISLKELSLKVGFLHTSYFTTQYKKRFGVHPIKQCA